MYEYLNKPPQVGDIVVWTQSPMPHPNRTRNKPYLVLDVGHLSVKVLDDTGTFCYYGLFHGFKILKTKPNTVYTSAKGLTCVSNQVKE